MYTPLCSEPPNPTCCNQTEGFSSAGFDFLTVNGGYRPILRMEPGVWQRWRIIYAGGHLSAATGMLLTAPYNLVFPMVCAAYTAPAYPAAVHPAAHPATAPP